MKLKAHFLQSGDILYDLQKRIRESSHTKMAVAYLSNNGLIRLEDDLLYSLKKKNKIDIIVGISNYFITDSKALGKLLELSNDFDNLQVSYYNSEGFHPKIFLFKNRKKTFAIIGSSNLTSPGLTTNTEANVLLEGEETDEIFKDLTVFYENLWRHSPLLKDNVVNEYARAQHKMRVGLKRTKLKLPINKLPKTSDLWSITNVRDLNRGIMYWKVAPGDDAHQWPLWEKSISHDSKGFIAIGWNLIDDLSDLMTVDEITFKSEVKQRVINANAYRSDPNYVSRQFWKFCRQIEKYDIIVAYSERHIFGIAEVKGPYHFDKKEKFGDNYAHKRDVLWKALPTVVPPKHIMSIIATRDTVHPIKNSILLRYIKRLL